MKQPHDNDKRKQGEEYGDSDGVPHCFSPLLITKQNQQDFLSDCRKGRHDLSPSRIAEQLCLKVRRLHLQEIPCIATMVEADPALRVVDQGVFCG